MTLYNVHIYREMRLYFPDIEAVTPEEAARIAADQPTDHAEYTDDCDGETLAALIDVVGDDQHEQSITIDFEPELLRKAVPLLLEALQAFIEAHELAEECHEWKWENLEPAFQLARAAIAQVTPINQPERSHP